jgi:hypothetical protein
MSGASRVPESDGRPLRSTPRAGMAGGSLIVDEGAGGMLGLAIGDVAARRRGYGTGTQAATIVAYHLMEHGELVPPALLASLVELWETDGGVYADPSGWLEDYLRSAADGHLLTSAAPTVEPTAWAVPIGIWFRDDADALVDAAATLASMSTTDAASIASTVAVAGAVAAGAIAMSGWDFVLACAETAERAVGMLGGGVSNVAGASRVAGALRRMSRFVGKPPAVIAQVLDDVVPALHGPLVAIGSAADVAETAPMIVESVARSHGPAGSAVTGAILGARLGLRRWPWRVPNETWFAEIGRRLVHREREYLDLPIPKAVEERVMSAEPVDPSKEID